MSEKHVMRGSEFAVLKGHGFPSRRYLESDCESFLITIDTRRDEDALEAARHIKRALNSHDALVDACELALNDTYTTLGATSMRALITALKLAKEKP